MQKFSGSLKLEEIYVHIYSIKEQPLVNVMFFDMQISCALVLPLIVSK